jgi:penicillin-binding protein 1A
VSPRSSRRPAPPPGHAERRPPWRRGVRLGLRTAVVTIVGLPLFAGLAAATAFGMLLYTNLPGTFPKARPPKAAQPSIVYDASGHEIGEFRRFDLSVPMTEQQVPDTLKNAVIANEDHKFWTHRGVDPEGMVRAAVADYTSGKVEQGGSTITQQYVRATYLNDNKTVSRKLNEAVLATRLERDLTKQLGSQHAAKEMILFRYLNTTYFGDGAYGAAAAAESYFHVPVQKLTISQAATLASIIPSPSNYSPRGDLFGAETRRVRVLGEMRDQGLITEKQYQTAKQAYLWPAGFGHPSGRTTAFYPLPTNGPSQDPYFVDYVRNELQKRYGAAIYTDGLKIYTTIQPALQADAQLVEQKWAGSAPTDTYTYYDTASKTYKSIPNPVDMAVVTVDPTTGYITDMVGGRNYKALNVNLAAGYNSLGKQPGSSFKAFTLAAALEQGFSPDKTVYPAPAVYYPTYCHGDPRCLGIHNSEGGAEGGAVSMATATAQSINTWFAQLARDVGPDNVAAMAQRLGVDIIAPEKHYDERITIGYKEVSPLSMAAAYGVFANHGVKMPLTAIIKIVKPDGTVIDDHTHPVGTQVLNPAIAETVTQLLTGPILHGTASKALSNFGRPAAGKTGTTDEESDAWFVGYTPQLSTAVWMGHDGPIQPLRLPGYGAIFGATIPAPAWGDFMHLALAGKPALPFPTPGPLPPANSAADVTSALDPRSRSANNLTIPQVPTNCDGPCSQSTSLTTPPPPTTAPPPTSTSTSSTSTTSTTLGSTTTTTKKGPHP